MSFKTIT